MTVEILEKNFKEAIESTLHRHGPDAGFMPTRTKASAE